MAIIQICDNPLCGRPVNSHTEVICTIHRKGGTKIKRKPGPGVRNGSRVKRTCPRCAELTYIEFLPIPNLATLDTSGGGSGTKSRVCDNCGRRVSDSSEVTLDLDRRGSLQSRRKPGRKADAGSRHVCSRCAQLGYIEFRPIPGETLGDSGEFTYAGDALAESASELPDQPAPPAPVLAKNRPVDAAELVS